MTDQEIENALASALGWEEVSSWQSEHDKTQPEEWWGWERQSDTTIEWKPIPKFCSDLNVCASAEKVLLKTEPDRRLYNYRLTALVGGHYPVFSDAKSRALMLLQMVNDKYEDYDTNSK